MSCVDIKMNFAARRRGERHLNSTVQLYATQLPVNCMAQWMVLDCRCTTCLER